MAQAMAMVQAKTIMWFKLWPWLKFRPYFGPAGKAPVVTCYLKIPEIRYRKDAFESEL